MPIQNKMEYYRNQLKAKVVSLMEINSEEMANGIHVRFLTQYEKFWDFSGLWPEKGGRKNTWYSHLRYIYPRFTIALGCFSICFPLGVYIFLHPHAILRVNEVLCQASLNLLAIAKILTFLAQPDKFRKLVERMDQLHASQRYENTYCQVLLKKIRIASKFTLVYFGSGLVTLMVLIAIVTDVTALVTRMVPFSGWFPCDVSTAPCFEAVIFYQTLVAVTHIQMIGIADAVVFELLLHTWGQFKMVRHNLLTVREHAAQKVRKMTQRQGTSFQDSLNMTKRGNIVRSSLLGSVTNTARAPKNTGNVGGNIIYKRRERKTRERGSIKLLVISIKKEREIKRRKQLDGEMERRLTQCAKHHQGILSFTDELQSFCNPFLSAQLMGNLIVTSLGVLSIATNPSPTMREIVILVLVLLLLLESFVFSWLANQITQESGEVKDSIYGCEWLEASESFKKSMRIIISRSNDPVVIKVAEFLPLSMETFQSVTKSAYSSFMVLQTVAENKLK